MRQIQDGPVRKRVLLLGDSIEGGKKIPGRAQRVVFNPPENQSGERTLRLCPCQCNLLDGAVVGDEDATDSSGVLKERRIYCPFWERVDRAKNVPATMDEAIDQGATETSVGEDGKATSH